MNKYKFINSESLANSITNLLKSEMDKIHFIPEFRECELTDAWLKEYVHDRIEDANEEMDIVLDAAYDPCTTAFFRIDVDYNKHITGTENERDDAQFKDLVKRIKDEDHHTQTKSDLEFINTWYLATFAQDNIVKPFIEMLDEWQKEWA